MSYNKEWEQIKTEYKEIPVPEHGMAQMEEAIKRATYHRSRRRKLTAYGAMAAALLLILLLPKMGGLALDSSAKSENATGAVALIEDGSVAYTEEERETSPSAFYNGVAKEIADAEADTGTDFDTIKGIGMYSPMPQMEQEKSVVSELVIEIESEDSILSFCLSEEEVKEINQEISYQMESVAEQTAFFGISEEQAYYINEDGLLVVVWEEETLEFIIPKYIISIEE